MFLHSPSLLHVPGPHVFSAKFSSSPAIQSDGTPHISEQSSFRLVSTSSSPTATTSQAVGPASVPTASRPPPTSTSMRTQSPKKKGKKPVRSQSPIDELQGEYATGRVVCDCGDHISFRDETTGEFDLKLWEAHRAIWCAPFLFLSSSPLQTFLISNLLSFSFPLSLSFFFTPVNRQYLKTLPLRLLLGLHLQDRQFHPTTLLSTPRNHQPIPSSHHTSDAGALSAQRMSESTTSVTILTLLALNPTASCAPPAVNGSACAPTLPIAQSLGTLTERAA